MTNAQKLALRASPKSVPAWPNSAGVEEITDEHARRDRHAPHRIRRHVETRSQAAIVAGDEPKPTETATEARELAELIEGSSIGANLRGHARAPLHRWPDARAARGAGPEPQPNPACATPRHRAPRDRRDAGTGRRRRDASRDHPGCFSGLELRRVSWESILRPWSASAKAVFPVLSTSPRTLGSRPRTQDSRRNGRRVHCGRPEPVAGCKRRSSTRARIARGSAAWTRHSA